MRGVLQREMMRGPAHALSLFSDMLLDILDENLWHVAGFLVI